ncbi:MULTISPECIES: hypothetical protein [Borrelia]|uniref:Lipoprotein n=1 Tax=Borrelia crocidurae (strain Achema) TaxID=1155096 RepID=I0FE63_BORCA|nr:hypothetical protein [Borrelia crocidurae]AFI31769.1 hypothetical protein Q7M_1061 [Borrelia crocidurae str. Achema]
MKRIGVLLFIICVLYVLCMLSILSCKQDVAENLQQEHIEIKQNEFKFN